MRGDDLKIAYRARTRPSRVVASAYVTVAGLARQIRLYSADYTKGDLSAGATRGHKLMILSVRMSYCV